MWSRRAFFIPDTYLPQAQSASGERRRHADRGGVRLFKSLGPRLNLFAFTVPVFRGNELAVFVGSLCLLLAVLVPLRISAIHFAVFEGYFGLLLAVLIPRRPDPVSRSWPRSTDYFDKGTPASESIPDRRDSKPPWGWAGLRDVGSSLTVSPSTWTALWRGGGFTTFSH